MKKSVFIGDDREVMSHPVVTLQAVEKVSRVVEVLTNEHHDGFPIVENVDSTVIISLFSLYSFYWSGDLFKV